MCFSKTLLLFLMRRRCTFKRAREGIAFQHTLPSLRRVSPGFWPPSPPVRSVVLSALALLDPSDARIFCSGGGREIGKIMRWKDRSKNIVDL